MRWRRIAERVGAEGSVLVVDLGAFVSCSRNMLKLRQISIK